MTSTTPDLQQRSCCFRSRRPPSSVHSSPKIPRPSAPAACWSRPASTTARTSVSGLRPRGQLLRLPLIGVSVGVSSIAEIQIDGGLYNRLSITERNLGAAVGHGDRDRRLDVERRGLVIGTKVRLLSEGVRPAGVRFPVRDQAAERVERKRPRPRHDGLLCVAAGRQDGAVDSRRRQRRPGDPRRPDARRSAERRADLRLVVGPRADAGGRSGRRDQRPHGHARRRRRRPAPSRGARSASARATPSAAGAPMRRCCSA